MKGEVFYRKWRPQSLAEVAGQEHVTTTLKNALESGRIAHAYLFCGPRGTGKTSTGRILAKAVNCYTNGRGEPCNNCESCISIYQGRSLDVIEIDAASNRGIDDIRNLRERVAFPPGSSRYKVYIIDEVHMLTEPASNALLKTLEEPPPYIIFILATTELHSVLPTIQSRCQRFDFHRLAQSAIVSRLKFICEHEDITTDDATLKLIARYTSGSLRDATNLLEQLIAYYGGKIEVSQIREMLGITADYRVKELARHILHSDLNNGFNTIHAVFNDGINLAQFNRELVEYLRNVLLVKSGAGKSLDITAEELSSISALTDSIPLNNILTAIKIFGKIDFSYDDYSTLPLELALVDVALTISSARIVSEKATSTSTISKIKTETPEVSEAKNATPVARITKPYTTQPVSTEALKMETIQSQAPETEEAPLKHDGVTITAQPSETISVDRLRANWKTILESAPIPLKRSNALALLRNSCQPVAIDNDVVTLEFHFEMHKDNIEKLDNRRIAEEIISNYIGRRVKINCTFRPREKSGKIKINNNPFVKHIKEYGGRIIKVEENEQANFETSAGTSGKDGKNSGGTG